jgi:MFS family permease
MTTASAKRGLIDRLIKHFQAKRTLDVYPTGAYRWVLLLLTFASAMIALSDLSFAGLLPLFMSTLHFTAKDFSHYLIFAVLISGIAAMVGGPIADRHGRVLMIDLCLGAIILLIFCNLLMTGFWSFLVVRGLMNVISGLMAGAIHGITRDMSPRLGRGAAFGVASCGSAAAYLVWTFVPGITLPYFHTWQSQIWIIGVFVALVYIPVVLWLKDLSPALRFTIVESEASAASAVRRAVDRQQTPQTAGAAFDILLRRWDVWALVLGSVGVLSITITMQTFGPLMYVQTFKYTPAQASKIASYFFLTHLLAFVPFGYLSDVLRMRKTVIFPMTGLLVGVLVWWICTFSHPLSPIGLGILNLALGALSSAAVMPWYAFYSEYLENISPALQATGWAFFHLIFRTGFAVIGLAQPYVAQHFGWASWMWIVVVALLFYLLSLLLVRGYWRPATVTTGVIPVPARA